jgi:Ca2+-binding EF-hand superfamily protein
LKGFDQLEEAPKSIQDWQRVWQKIDLDIYGDITFNEFVPITLDMKTLSSEEHFRSLFRLNTDENSDEMSIEDLKDLLNCRNRVL